MLIFNIRSITIVINLKTKNTNSKIKKLTNLKKTYQYDLIDYYIIYEIKFWAYFNVKNASVKLYRFYDVLHIEYNITQYFT